MPVGVGMVNLNCMTSQSLYDTFSEHLFHILSISISVVTEALSVTVYRDGSLQLKPIRPTMHTCATKCDTKCQHACGVMSGVWPEINYKFLPYLNYGSIMYVVQWLTSALEFRVCQYNDEHYQDDKEGCNECAQNHTSDERSAVSTCIKVQLEVDTYNASFAWNKQCQERHICSNI